MRISIHPGHNPDGKVACGAVGILRESTCARNICNEIKRLTDKVEVFSIEDGTSQNDVLNKIVDKINSQNVDLSISVHLNAAENNAAEGAEAYVWDPTNPNAISVKFAKKWLENMGRCGYVDRGVKSGKTLRVIHATNCRSVLLECGFVTNRRDCNLFNATDIAKTILDALGIDYENKPSEEEIKKYQVVVGTFLSKKNAENFRDKVIFNYPDAYIKEV